MTDDEFVLQQLAAPQQAPPMSEDDQFVMSQLDQQRSPPPPARPLDDMGALETGIVGVGAGMDAMARGAGNMIGLDNIPFFQKEGGGGYFSDEAIMAQKAIDEEGGLNDSTAGQVGKFIGETVALAPLGFVGKGAHALSGALKAAGSTGRVAKYLGGTAVPMAVESGLAGAIAANPNERGAGAAVSAGLGLSMNRIAAVGSRIFNRGLVKQSDDAMEFSKKIAESTGVTPFIPLRQAKSDVGDSVSSTVAGAANLAHMLPGAKDSLLQQSNDLAMLAYEKNIRDVFFFPNKARAAVKVLRETGGDITAAMEAGRKNVSGKMGKFTPEQKILAEAGQGNMMGQYTPKQLYNAGQKAVPVGEDLRTAPFRDMAIKMDKIIGRPSGSSDVATRDVYHTIGNALGAPLGIVPSVSSLLGSKGFQNFLMGNTKMQKRLQRAIDNGKLTEVNEVLKAIARSVSTHPRVQDTVSAYLPGEEDA